jgi:hypothetical protein
MHLSPNFFSPDYSTARHRFREMVAASGGTLEILTAHTKGPAGEDLTIDIAWFGSEKPVRVLVHSSGLHGVEGFAGSAIQLQFLQNIPRIPSDAALVIVHVLNPYGMAWLRRTNENNVDLNRNCVADQSYAGAPPDYARLNAFLNPNNPPSLDFFAARAALLVLRHGMAALKQSILEGQYEFPRGLFFGGKTLQPALVIYKRFLELKLRFTQKILTIDIHTGLGRFAQNSLLVEAPAYPRLKAVFGDHVVPLAADKGPAYRVRGGLADLIKEAAPRAEADFIGQEFGTYPPLKVLHALREENRWHHFGTGSLDHYTKRTLKQVFYPDNDSWRRAVLKHGHELCERAIASLARG